MTTMAATRKSVRARVRFECGHTGEMNLSGTEAACRRKAALSAAQPCNECLALIACRAEMAEIREAHDRWRARHPDRSETWDLTGEQERAMNRNDDDIEYEPCEECGTDIPWGYLVHHAHDQSCSLYDAESGNGLATGQLPRSAPTAPRHGT